MRSIRLSLLVYLLILLAVALGAASMLAYENARSTLAKKTELHREKLQAKYEEDCTKERSKLDSVLRQRARYLAGRAMWQRMSSINMAPLGVLSSGGLDPNGIYLLPNWLGEHSPLRDQLFHAPLAEFRFADMEHDSFLTGYANGDVTEYFQINSDNGKVWRSHSMGEHFFQIDLGHLRMMQPGREEPLVDDVELTPGVPLRRVTIRGSMRFPFFAGRGRRFFERPGPPPADNSERNQNTSAFYVQCSAETAHRDQALADLGTKLEETFAQLEEESKLQLASMRNRLLLISLITFTATTVGGFLLVRAGLSPLRRLSQAVSQVSEKDFRLPIDERQLPVELRPISKRLEQTLDQLKRAFAREKQAAADISHELRTPLAALLTTIEVGLKKPRSPDEYRELLEDCHATGLQMNHLVERLLALARLDAGVDTLRARPVDVTNLVEQCAEVVLPLAKAHGLSLTVHRNGPIEINTDPDKLREVLSNLLHNAVEYNRPEGTIDVTMEQGADSLKLAVRDSGIGIAPSAREHIFERFFRADSSRQATGLHAGLGLAIVKNYVDLMGGQIRVESHEGQGSTFIVELPVGRTVLNRRLNQESFV